MLLSNVMDDTMLSHVLTVHTLAILLCEPQHPAEDVFTDEPNFTTALREIESLRYIDSDSRMI